MIPIQLTIKGLYSYQKEQTIDFTKLTAANLFGIFGSVGCGKSSILEAITFALYGKTDRLNEKGDSRNYNMMNLKSNELLIDFMFETGINNTVYRAVVSGKRNRNQFEKVERFDRSAYEKMDKTWRLIETSELESAINLSYANFKRTIIIPQGQFQEFLQLKPTDRTRMMTELFNLQRFELYYKAAALESKNNENKQNLQGQLQQLGEIDPNKITEFETLLVQLKKELTELEEKLKSKQKQETQFQQIQELTKKLETAKTNLELLQKQEPAFLQQEKNIADYEKCVLQFKNVLEMLTVSTKKIFDKAKQIETDSAELAKEEAGIAENEVAFDKIKPVYERRETLKQRAEELEKLVKIKELKKALEGEIERLSNGNKTVLDTTKSIEKLSDEKQKLNEKIKLQKAELPDLALLSTIKTWHIEKLNIDKQTDEINSELNKLRQESEKLLLAIKDILEQPNFDGLTNKTDFSETLSFSQSKVDSLKAAIKKLDAEAQHLHVKVQLEKYATELSDGNPCPLCGSMHHPEVYSAMNIREDQNKIENEKLALEKQAENWNETISALKDLNSQQKFRTEALNDRKKKLDENQKKVVEHNSVFEWPEYTEVAKVESAFSVAEILQKEIKKNENNLDKLADELEKSIKNKERFQAEIDKIKTRITVHETEHRTLLLQLKIVSVEEYAMKSVSEIEAEKRSLLLQFADLEKHYNEITIKLTNLRKSKDTLSGILSANREALEQEKENNLALQNQLNTQLQKSDYGSVEEVNQILSQSMDLEKEKQKVNDFKQNLALAKSRFGELKNEMGERVYDAELHEKLRVEIAAIIENQNLKNRERGKTEELLKKLQSDLQKQAELIKLLEKLELRAENIKTMKSLFKASGFVNYISSVYLQNLCNAANDRFFKLTRQKLSLEITPDNNFEVRDFMNGGKTRNVKTLSGGQTFQAALSLALSLADNIQKITESNQNFFFLDEGFGSLDKDSLSVVFDTLKSLRKENRIVGVISHVEEMQDEIDVHLRIENNDETGSLIYESWAG